MPAAKPRTPGTGILASRAEIRGPASTPAGPQARSINPGDKTPPEMGSPHKETLISATATSLSAGAGGRQEVRAHQPWRHPVFPTGWPAPPRPQKPSVPPPLPGSRVRPLEVTERLPLLEPRLPGKVGPHCGCSAQTTKRESGCPNPAACSAHKSREKSVAGPGRPREEQTERSGRGWRAGRARGRSYRG